MLFTQLDAYARSAYEFRTTIQSIHFLLLVFTRQSRHATMLGESYLLPWHSAYR